MSFYACVDCIDVWFQSLKTQNVEFSADRKIPIENAKRWGKCWVVEFSPCDFKFENPTACSKNTLKMTVAIER